MCLPWQDHHISFVHAKPIGDKIRARKMGKRASKLTFHLVAERADFILVEHNLLRQTICCDPLFRDRSAHGRKGEGGRERSCCCKPPNPPIPPPISPISPFATSIGRGAGVQSVCCRRRKRSESRNPKRRGGERRRRSRVSLQRGGQEHNPSSPHLASNDQLGRPRGRQELAN